MVKIDTKNCFIRKSSAYDVHVINISNHVVLLFYSRHIISTIAKYNALYISNQQQQSELPSLIRPATTSFNAPY